MIEHWQLQQRQSLGLEEKVLFARHRIREFLNAVEDKAYISFSGGKDSTVLLHLVREINPNIPAMFVDTGLEFPEIREFVKTIPNVGWVKPKLPFNEIIREYGYPVVSKEVSQKLSEIMRTKSSALMETRLYGDSKGNGKCPDKWQFLKDAPFKISDRCCNFLKKNPAKKYEKETGRFPIIGTMASDSRLRQTEYLKSGCNALERERKASRPLSIWNEADIWEYIKTRGIPYSKIYDMGYTRTGCIFCMFGLHLDSIPNRFDILNDSHPQLFKYCMENLGLRKVIEFVNKRA